MAGLKSDSEAFSYETAFQRLVFPFYERVVKGRETATYLAEYEHSQWLSQQHILEIQLSKLNALLSHCWTNVPFLNRWWRSYGLQPGPLKSAAELERFPIITKDIIRDNYAEMVARNWLGRTLSKTTGGSTGDPFKFEYTMDSYARRTAVMFRGYRWAGADLGTRTFYVWGLPIYTSMKARVKDLVYQGIYRRRYLNSSSMRDDRLDEYLNDFERFRPKVLVGFVAPLLVLARRILESGRVVQPFRGVVTGAEALYSAERSLLEAAFRSPVFNTYGCREVMLMAAECSEHKGLHTSADHLVLETVDSSGKHRTGEPGDVVLTDLHNYGMPFVRYRNGDIATYADDACACGRGLPLLSDIQGRVLDLITTPDGRLLPGEFIVYLMLDAPSVKRYQVVQTKLDEIEFRLEMNGTALSEADRVKMERKTRTCVGEKMKIKFCEVDKIPASKSGKRRITVSLVNASQLDPL